MSRWGTPKDVNTPRLGQTLRRIATFDGAKRLFTEQWLTPRWGTSKGENTPVGATPLLRSAASPLPEMFIYEAVAHAASFGLHRMRLHLKERK
jgi:hypothetical protein